MSQVQILSSPRRAQIALDTRHPGSTPGPADHGRTRHDGSCTRLISGQASLVPLERMWWKSWQTRWVQAPVPFIGRAGSSPVIRTSSRRCSSVRSEHLSRKEDVVGSNPTIGSTHSWWNHGRHARLRAWCPSTGVRVRTPPSAPFRGAAGAAAGLWTLRLGVRHLPPELSPGWRNRQPRRAQTTVPTGVRVRFPPRGPATNETRVAVSSPCGAHHVSASS